MNTIKWLFKPRWQRVILGAVITISIAAGLPFGAFAWSTKQDADSICIENEAAIDVSFSNTEKGDLEKYSMDVVAVDLQTGKSVDLGTVLPGETVSGRIETGLASLSTGTVRFDVTWTNRPGNDNRFDNYKARNCTPPEPDMQLNISHINCFDAETGKVEVHFVVVHVPDGVNPEGSSVSYQVAVPSDGTLDRTAPFDKLSGKTAHYTDYLTGYGDGIYTILEASVIVNETTVGLHNPGPFMVSGCTAPTPEPTPVVDASGSISCEEAAFTNEGDVELFAQFYLDGQPYDSGTIAVGETVTLTLNLADGNTHTGMLVYWPTGHEDQKQTLELGSFGPCGSTPTPEPTEPPPTECIDTDLKGRFVTDDHYADNPVQGFLSNLSDNPECANTLWVHIFGAMQEPETDGWLENQEYVTSYSYQVPTGTNDMEIWVDVPAAGYCWYQVDLVDTSEVLRPPYYITWDYAFVKGEVDCGQPPVRPEKPVCPTCPPYRVDENDHAATDVTVVSVAVKKCVVVWDADKGKWCRNLDQPDSHVLRAWRQGGTFNIALPGETWVTETHTGADGLEYSTLRQVAPYRWDFSYWDGETPGEKRLRDEDTEVHEFWGPCGVTVGYHDTELVDGVAYGHWWEGHNVYEWAEFLMNNGYFDNRADAESWALQLQAQGIGGSLALPDIGT